jgi:hydrogenase/urease accessory protein HupE
MSEFGRSDTAINFLEGARIMNRLGIIAIAATTAITAATSAQAHNSTEIGGGFLHPVSGVDHLMALIASLPTGLLVGGAIAATVAGLGAVHMVRRSRQH